MEQNEYFNKIISDKELSEKEIKDLIYDYGLVYDDITGEVDDWVLHRTTIVKLLDRLFAIDWEQGLCGSEDEYSWQPYEVKRVEKMEKVVKYEKVMKHK